MPIEDFPDRTSNPAIGLIIHVYMGAVFPEEKEGFFSMYTGDVSAWMHAPITRNGILRVGRRGWRLYS
jgi:hypothetical protein